MTNLVTIKVMKSCVFSPNYFRASSLTIIFVVAWEEEFIIILENTHVETAFHLAEQIRQRFAEHPFFEPNEHIYLCAGVSSLHHGDHDIADIYRRSDQALYKAKRNGRNRCCIYRQSTE